MRMPRVRFTVRRMMIVVAIMSLFFGWIAHVQALVTEEDDFAGSILIVEEIAVIGLVSIFSAVAFFIQLMRRDHAYLAELRRKDVPALSPWLPVAPDLPEPE